MAAVLAVCVRALVRVLRNVGLQLQVLFFAAASATDSESGAEMPINIAAAAMAVVKRLFILPPGHGSC